MGFLSEAVVKPWPALLFMLSRSGQGLLRAGAGGARRVPTPFVGKHYGTKAAALEERHPLPHYSLVSERQRGRGHIAYVCCASPLGLQPLLVDAPESVASPERFITFVA